MDTQTDSLGAIEHELMVFLRRVESARRTIGTLDRSAYLLLGELETNGPRGISTLAETLHLDISTASRQTAALESKGLVERLPDPEDGRISLLRATPLGQTQFYATRAARIALMSSLLADWREEDRHQFATYLVRFNQALDQQRPVSTK
jgi:DNA-binding MarR family transcriptional regulator